MQSEPKPSVADLIFVESMAEDRKAREALCPHTRMHHEAAAQALRRQAYALAKSSRA